MADSMVTPMTITMVVCSAVSLLFLSLRFLSKYLVASKPGIDDAVLAFSWILLVIFVIISIYATKLGLGRHLEDVDLTRLPDLLYLLPIGQFFAVISVAVSKSSFILTLLRLIEGTVYWHKILLWFMLVTINASMFSIAIVQFYLCSDPPTKACVDGNIVIGLGVYAAGYSAAMDLVLTAFPSLVIWNLQIKRQDKVGIIISMSLGVVAGVVGIYKTSTIPGIARNADFTYGTAFPLIWLVAEVDATIIAASIPFFRPLVRAVMGTKQKNSYSLSKRSRSGANPLGSQPERPGFDSDNGSDRNILSLGGDNPSKLNTTVPHSYHIDEGRVIPEAARREHRDSF